MSRELSKRMLLALSKFVRTTHTGAGAFSTTFTTASPDPKREDVIATIIKKPKPRDRELSPSPSPSKISHKSSDPELQ